MEQLFQKRNSTKQPATTGTQVDCHLKEATSIESPTFIVSGFSLDWNYCQAFGHYYFIDDIVITTNNVAEISCTQDVLATYKTDIGNYTAFVERAANNYDVNVKDPYISMRQPVATSATAQTTFFTSPETNGQYLLRVLGKNGIKQYKMGDTGLGLFLQGLYNSGSGSYIDDFKNSITFSQDIVDVGSDELVELLIEANYNPGQNIISCKWFPFDVNAGTAEAIWAGYHNTGHAAFPVTDKIKTIMSDVQMPAAYYNDFRDYDNEWSRYNIYIPGIGNTDLDASSLSSGLKIIYVADLTTGSVIAYLRNGSGHILSVLTGMVGVDIQLAFGSAVSELMSQLDIGSKVTKASTKLFEKIDYLNIGNKIGQALKGINAGDIAARNIGQSVGGISQAASMMIANSSFQDNAKVVGIPGTLANVIAQPNILVTVLRYGSKDIPTSVLGRPVYKNEAISTHSGYVKCDAASIDIGGLSDDKAHVNAYLNSGFYYE